MKRFKILLILLFSLAICCCVSACNFNCGGGSSNNSDNSNNTNNSSNNSNNDNSQEIDTDGTFIFSGSSIKPVDTNISGAIVIPSEHNGNTIDTIPQEAFKGCKQITSVVVPNTITSIGEGAFSGCSLLKSITLPFVGSQKGNNGSSSAQFGYIFGDDSYQGGTRIDSYGSYSDWYIPTTLREVTITNETILTNGAFYYCSILTKITLNDGIVQAGIACFQNCSKIEEINLPDITIIPSSMLKNCIALKSFEIGDSVDTIGSDVFSGCTSLTSINSDNVGEYIIPNSITSIGEGAFSGCSMLRKITLPFIGSQKGNTGSSSAQFGYIFGDDSYQGGTAVDIYRSYSNWYIPTTLREVTITNETVIAAGAFYDCNMLTKIEIDSAANNNIGASAFAGATDPTWI